MKLILTEDVSGLGGKGEVVEVADGYGRNFLLPKRLAMRATAGALRDAEGIRTAHEETLRKVLEEAEATAGILVGTRVVLAAQAGDEGKLFGSISTTDVVDGVLKFTGVQLDRSTVQMAAPIKSIGLHEVMVKLHPEVQFSLTIDVIPA
ncbi:MAG: 50S ribosomal protein L9 [Acidimicrobiia bacterium]|nr:50S ribosomal protein L9 [Acidimicrobiia bacterium]MDH3397008.1 50S ribosomal protein L9 [Acidimicrobiia bacterium]